MFEVLGKLCKRCGGRLIDEWKLDLPFFREIVCLNCGDRYWEKLKGVRYERKRKQKRKRKRGRKPGRIIYVRRKVG